ncbi:Uu.00g033730.m01.CDS01 [Anthostomella pinea]|uniref:Uu.00g033730.m01.CDS01 n=1 Tax=Anthostomella pinea TaxID=933095 RepID=A0AAI8YD97_9PEZI|nr:Uu.00g033730.m01.CDS01 [Anthostomella pinea]
MQNDFKMLIRGAPAQEGDVLFYIDVIICYPRQASAQDPLHELKLSDAKIMEMNVQIWLRNWTKSVLTPFEAVLALVVTFALNDEAIKSMEL